MTRPRHIASCSGGKDSVATILLAAQNNEPLDEIVFAEVMFDPNTTGEVPNSGTSSTISSNRSAKKSLESSSRSFTAAKLTMTSSITSSFADPTRRKSEVLLGPGCVQ